ncbi:hypothetical protein [Streptomyces sp. YS415]|uniref:hypothetical protein n=1 Tax=Streptomyces sp. YS415 TaxID=2944806 RepID=UPI0027E271BB|nr:hypothetical protein [Streptomyces sp. YS415]
MLGAREQQTAMPTSLAALVRQSLSPDPVRGWLRAPAVAGSKPPWCVERDKVAVRANDGKQQRRDHRLCNAEDHYRLWMRKRYGVRLILSRHQRLPHRTTTEGPGRERLRAFVLPPSRLPGKRHPHRRVRATGHPFGERLALRVVHGELPAQLHRHPVR